MTGLALKHMLENSFSEAEGARPAARNIPRIGLVFTDGRSQDDITEWAKLTKEAGKCDIWWPALYMTFHLLKGGLLDLHLPFPVTVHTT